MSETLTHLPVHLAIIMDGNGRWAQARGLPREAGHRAGAETVRTIVTECRRLGIRHLTLYTFSSENWSRPKTEVSALFSLLLEFLGQEVPRMEREGIRLNILGDMEALPLAARTALRHGLRRTAANTDMVLNLALNYGGRAELVRAVRSMMAEGLRPEDVTEQSLADHLYTAGQPDPDFLIRTSGEQRLSNYLLYQCAYSEFYFTPTPWPDFGVEALHEARAQADQGVLRAVGPGQRQHAPAQGDGADAAGDALVAPEQGEELPQAQRRHQQDEGKQHPAPQDEGKNDDGGQNEAGDGAADVGGVINGH